MIKKQSPEKRFSEALLSLSRTQSLYQVFDDFLDFALLYSRWWEPQPDSLLEVIKKYPDREAESLFSEAYRAMGDIADHGGAGFKDPFGDFFMEYLSSDRKGQFFTPEELCELQARMMIPEELPDDATIADPCCGSGRLLLAAAKINRRALFYAADLDLTCCKMTLLNFIMNTMSGEIAWMNTLSLEVWKTWKVDKVMDGNGMYLPYYQELAAGDSSFPVRLGRTMQRDEPAPAPAGPAPALPAKRKKKPTNQLFLDF